MFTKEHLSNSNLIMKINPTVLGAILTIVFLCVNMHAFSQENIRIQKAVFVDEEFSIIRDSNSAIIVMEEGFPPNNDRYILFEIELLNSYTIPNIEYSDFSVFFDTITNATSLFDCCYAKQTDSSVFIHAYCIVTEKMIPGGRDFIHDDLYSNYQHLRDTLQQTMKIVYLRKKDGKFWNLELPQISIVSPQLTTVDKSNIRLDFCPCSRKKFGKRDLKLE